MMGAYPTWVAENGHQRLYNIWAKMLYRCRNPKCDHFQNYGGRGISVSEEWWEFRPFAAWALGSGYTTTLTLERRDNSKNYTRENCSWVTRREQNQNQRKTHRLPDGSAGVEAARQNGVPAGTFRSRISLGWPAEIAATAPRGARLKSLLKVYLREGG